MKFHPSFHQKYNNEDYRIRFCFNRTALKRCHFAISFVKKQLGAKVLFPKDINIQLPQTVYIDTDNKMTTSPAKFLKLVNQFESCNELGSILDENGLKTSHKLEKSLEEDDIIQVDKLDFKNGNITCKKDLNFYLKDRDEIALLHNKLSRSITTDQFRFIPRVVEISLFKNSKSNEENSSSNTNERKNKNLNKTSWVNNNSFNNNLIKIKGIKYVSPSIPITKKPPDMQIEGNIDIPILKWNNNALNSEQKLAVRRVLEGTTRPMPYIIYGPPGTGKTVCVVESVLQIFKLVHHSRILIVTPSNSASDLITERLISAKILNKDDIIRVNAYQVSIFS